MGGRDWIEVILWSGNGNYFKESESVSMNSSWFFSHEDKVASENSQIISRFLKIQTRLYINL